jgi:ADP-ribose pyrophosphatase YjhB (NUDIX family)
MKIIFPFLLGLYFSITLYAVSIEINSEIVETMAAPALKDYGKVDIQGCFRNGEEVFYALLNSPQPAHRKNFSPGHLTASALIFNPTEDKILLIHHEKLNQWVYPGGHYDQKKDGSDYFLLKTVIREIKEEVGIEELKLIPPKWGAAFPHFFQVFPIGLSQHRSQSEPSHYHFDAAYMFKTSEEYPFDKIHGTFWMSLEELLSQYQNYEALKDGISLDTCALCLKGHRILENYRNQLGQLLKSGLFQWF